MADLSAFPITTRWPAADPDVIQLYAYPTPNGVKASIALEELGLDYEPHLVKLSDDEVKSDEFTSLNPNGKIPAIIDPNGPDGRPVGAVRERCDPDLPRREGRGAAGPVGDRADRGAVLADVPDGRRPVRSSASLAIS